MTTDKPYWEQDIAECLRVAAEIIGPNSYYLRAAEYIDEIRAERDRLLTVNAQLLAALKRAEQLARGMGNIIRELDEENEHLEFWNNDGEYLPCSEYSDIRAAITVAEQAGKGES